MKKEKMLVMVFKRGNGVEAFRFDRNSYKVDRKNGYIYVDNGFEGGKWSWRAINLKKMTHMEIFG